MMRGLRVLALLACCCLVTEQRVMTPSSPAPYSKEIRAGAELGWLAGANRIRQLGLVLRMSGGGKTKTTRPRSWKEQSTSHGRKRKNSIRKWRGLKRNEYDLEPHALRALQKQDDETRLAEIERKLAEDAKEKADLATSVSHQLRMQYMKLNEEEDARREEKYKTLDDYSDSVERELEELRQKRGESRGLMVPDWRKTHPTFWDEVERRTRDEEDLDNPEKVWKAGTEEGNLWKVAAFNRRNKDTDFEASNKMILSATGVAGGGGGGKMVAAAANAGDEGPKQYIEAPSSVEEEEEMRPEKEKEEASAKRKGGRGKGKARERERRRERVYDVPQRPRELA